MSRPPTERLRTHLAEVEATRPAREWTPPVGAIPAVLIHLTPFAPMLDDVADASDDRRWRWLSWDTPSVVLRKALLRLQRRADQITLRVIDGLDGVEVHDGADAPPPGCARLLAIIFDVPAAALRAAWAALLPSAVFDRVSVDGGTVLMLKPSEAA